jgi:Zn-dependent peptidase ImmA (M78 family)
MLHCEGARSNTLPLLGADRTMCRQGSRNPIEIQAEKFAGYLLVPADELMTRLPRSSWSGWAPVYRLAETFAVSPSAMLVRLSEMKLAYKDEKGLPRSGRPRPAGQMALPSFGDNVDA